jgi:hypothetical protein
MVFTEEPRYFFYPDFGDNLKQPEDKQVSVEIIRPTGYQRKEFTTTVVSREYYPDDQPYNSEGKARDVKRLKKATARVECDADYILRNCVGKVRNVSVKGSDGKEREIKTGEQLAECRAYGMESLVDAICNEVRSDTLTDSKKKITG